jgi:hypothetical protein
MKRVCFSWKKHYNKKKNENTSFIHRIHTKYTSQQENVIIDTKNKKCWHKNDSLQEIVGCVWILVHSMERVVDKSEIMAHSHCLMISFSLLTIPSCPMKIVLPFMLLLAMILGLKGDFFFFFFIGPPCDGGLTKHFQRCVWFNIWSIGWLHCCCRSWSSVASRCSS